MEKGAKFIAPFSFIIHSSLITLVSIVLGLIRPLIVDADV